jgi:methyl-accepting chemotaxis protein
MKLVIPRFTSLSARIPLMLIASAIVAALAVGLNSHLQATNALVRAETTMADAIARYRAGVVKRLGDSFAVDVRIMAASPAIRDAYEFIHGVYKPKDGAGAHYIQRKPAPGMTRADYLGEDDRTAYGVAHRRWHPMLQKMAQNKKLYDFFLITPDGDVIYTVEKEPDFATNLRTGPWRNTGLARAFEGALNKAQSGAPHFEDMEAYEPSNGDAAAFIAAAMLNDAGMPVGVVAVQLPDKVIADGIGGVFGEGGAAYVVGAGGRLRTAVESRGTHKLFAETPHADLIKRARTGNGVASAIGRSLDGSESYISAARAEFMGSDWYVIADLKSESINTAVQALAWKNGMIGLGIIALLSVVAMVLARGITGPMNRMRDAVAKIAAGESIDIPGVERKDELGDLARSLRAVHEAGVAAQQIKSGLDDANVNVMIANVEGRVVYANKALVAFFRAHAASFRKQFPSFSAEQILGATLDQFQQNAADRSARHARIKVDDLTIELNVNPITDGAGQPIGTITEWRNLTDDLIAIGEVTEVVDAAVRGDFSGRIREDNKSGALKDLAAGQNRINTIVESAMEEFSGTLRKVAEGDLVIRVNANHQGRFAQLGDGINDTIARLAETVGTIQRAAGDLSRAATEINVGASDLAKRTEEEAASLEETAATTEELAASVKQTADNSKVANELSDKARALASDGGTVVHQAIHAMERIEEASKKITDIISVIDDIAFQTNLLALNAAVEAARAGEAGKGFAVVASEVRTLAQRSGQAARDIKDLIVGSANQVTEGVKLVHATGDSLDKIVVASGEVAQMIGMIHSAASEQAHGIEEMSTAVARIDDMTQQNSALAEESAASAAQLIKQLERLNGLVAAFRIDASSRPQHVAAAGVEPERLRQLAADAFAQSRAPHHAAPARPTPAPAPQRLAAAGGGRGGQEWTEF